MDEISYEEIGGDSQERPATVKTNHCAFGQTWPATLQGCGTLGSKAGVLYGAHKERENRARAGAAAQSGKKTQARAGAEAGGDGTVGTEKAQASGARDGPDAGEVGVEARTRWVAKERVANEGQTCTTAVFWSRIVGTRATGNLPFFTIGRGSWAPKHWETCHC